MKIALIGNGRIARRHVEAISETDGLEIIGVAETNPVRRQSTVGISPQSFFPSIEELIDHKGLPDLFVVLVESGKHKSITLDLLRYRVPVLVEKPLALSLADGLEMHRAFDSMGVKLFVVKQNRLNPPVEAALQMITQGRLGRVLVANASVMWCRTNDYYTADPWRLSRSLDGGVVWNQASHYVDLLVLALGDIQSVFAMGDNFLSPAEAEDTVVAVLRSKGNALGSLQATTTTRPRNFEGSFSVSGSEGFLRVGGHSLNLVTASSVEGLPVSERTDEPIDYSKVYGLSHVGVYKEVERDLMLGERSQFRASESLHVLAVIEAMYLSIAERREVYLTELYNPARIESKR